MVKERLRRSRTLRKLRSVVLGFIDFFYPPFRKYLPLQTFRYAACGGGTALLNLVAFFIANNYILPPEETYRLKWHIIGFDTMEHYTAAFIISLCISFPVGFALNKYVVFQQSHLRGRVQLFRYAVMTGLNIFLNWALLHFFAGVLGFWNTPSQALTTGILAVLSYFAQTHFSFRSRKTVLDE